MAAATVAAAAFAGTILIRLAHAAQPVPKPVEIAWDDPATYVGVAFWIAGLAFGLTASRRWTKPGDYAFVAGIAAVSIPTVIFVMRRFESRAGRTLASTGAALAPVIPMSRAIQESSLVTSSSITVALLYLAAMLFVQWAIGVGRKPSPAPDAA